MSQEQIFYTIGNFADNGYIDLRKGYKHFSKGGELELFDIDKVIIYTEYNKAKFFSRKLEEIVSFYTSPKRFFVLSHKLDEDEIEKYYIRAYSEYWERVRKRMKERQKC